MAVGLGSMDMPVPAVAEWEWLNWKFPRAVHAGDTIYARWTLTQKRAPVGGSPTAIVVWRVDVHTAGGALCAEGEVGASVLRKVATKASAQPEEPIAPGAPPAPRRSRRRRRPAAGDGAKGPTEAKVVAAVEPSGAPPPKTAPERTASGTRRRRRRRSPGSAQARNGDGSTGSASAEAAPPPVEVAAAAASPALSPLAAGSANPLTRAIRRLRRP